MDREIVRQELRKLKEQRWWRDFIVLRGCGTNDANAGKAMFNRSVVLGIGIVQLSDMTWINNSAMVRACVADYDKRHLLLGLQGKSS